ncbi:MAG: TetR/AcrR family transcriptional regulator [Myxococcota bacterium]
MGRPKQYERIELLDRAVELFRRQGFNGTSTAELADELGVNRKSMYAEFGSKQGLFEAVLERYSDHHLGRVIGPLESPEADADTIRTAFEGYARASEGRFSGLGCLMANTAVERAALDPGSGRFVRAYLDRLTAAFRNALSNAQRDGQIGGTADVDELASFFMMSLIGVAACLRAEASPKDMWAATRVATGVLDRLQPAG